jgi:hypothetical protein
VLAVLVGGMGMVILLAAAMTPIVALSGVPPGGSPPHAAWMGAAWLRHRRSVT